MKLVLLATVAAVCCAPAWSQLTADQLVADLVSSENPQARAAALQILPTHGAGAAPSLVPLLTHDDALLAKTVFEILRDIANRSCTHGSEGDRRQITDLLMQSLDASGTPLLARKYLRILAIVTPEGESVRSIADLLDDPELGDDARTTLERIGTVDARKALRSALRGADPDRQLALLDSLGNLRDGESVPRIKRLARSDDRRVRVAAVHALAWTADPKLVPLFRTVRASADSATQLAADDALLRFADAIVDAGNGDIAAKLYRELVGDASASAIREAAALRLR